MDTSLLTCGLVVARVVSRRPRPNCTISKLGHLPSRSLEQYAKDCKVSCYACQILERDDDVAKDTISSYAINNSDDTANSTCLGNSTATSACPANSLSPATSLRPAISVCPATSLRPAISVCPAIPVRPDSIAYVVTTSGTTGVQKMVQVPHCSIVPNIVDLRSRFNIVPDDVVFNAAPLTFDPTIVEVIK